MKLTLKFNLIFVAVFGLGLLGTFFFVRQFLETNAREQVLRQARLMMETSVATRSYTALEVRPILEKLQHKGDVFYPPSVPAFAAIKMFTYLRAKQPEYTYREASLNPTNPQDRAVEWEADLINQFRNNAALPEVVSQRSTPFGESFYIAKPMRANAGCMPCHSTPQAAPPAMVKLYGSNNGFGWQEGSVVAAQIVNVPMSVPMDIANRALWQLMALLAAIALLSLAMLNVVLQLAVIRPIGQMVRTADEISRGNLDIEGLPVKGNDEISHLADSFNRMHRSLAKAMKMLEE